MLSIITMFLWETMETIDDEYYIDGSSFSGAYLKKTVGYRKNVKLTRTLWQNGSTNKISKWNPSDMTYSLLILTEKKQLEEMPWGKCDSEGPLRSLNFTHSLAFSNLCKYERALNDGRAQTVRERQESVWNEDIWWILQEWSKSLSKSVRHTAIGVTTYKRLSDEFKKVFLYAFQQNLKAIVKINAAGNFNHRWNISEAKKVKCKYSIVNRVAGSVSAAHIIEYPTWNPHSQKDQRSKIRVQRSTHLARQSSIAQDAERARAAWK